MKAATGYPILFDLRKDPQGMNNVYDDPAYAGIIRDLKAELLRLKEELDDRDEKGADPPGPSTAAHPDGKPDEAEARADRQGEEASKRARERNAFLAKHPEADTNKDGVLDGREAEALRAARRAGESGEKCKACALPRRPRSGRERRSSTSRFTLMKFGGHHAKPQRIRI